VEKQKSAGQQAELILNWLGLGKGTLEERTVAVDDYMVLTAMALAQEPKGQKAKERRISRIRRVNQPEV
jgi:hypothetical protein